MADAGTALAAILLTVWPSAGQVAEPATTLLTCRAAANAALVGRGNPLYVPEGEHAVNARCILTTPERAGFASGWDCIEGYNCR